MIGEKTPHEAVRLRGDPDKKTPREALRLRGDPDNQTPCCMHGVYFISFCV